MLVLSQTDNDRTVSVRVGDVVRISLPENASTGYRWTIERYDDEFLEALPAEAGYTSNSIGSGGDIAFMFCTRKAGTGQLVLKHWRHWEGDASITKRFRLQLQIQ
jgi:inhibitor of cysteine peptidase